MNTSDMQKPMMENGTHISIKIEDYNKLVNASYDLKIENNRLRKLEEKYNKLLKLRFENANVGFSENAESVCISEGKEFRPVNIMYISVEEYIKLKKLDEKAKREIKDLQELKDIDDLTQYGEDILDVLMRLYE